MSGTKCVFDCATSRIVDGFEVQTGSHSLPFKQIMIVWDCLHTTICKSCGLLQLDKVEL